MQVCLNAAESAECLVFHHRVVISGMQFTLVHLWLPAHMVRERETETGRLGNSKKKQFSIASFARISVLDAVTSPRHATRTHRVEALKKPSKRRRASAKN